MFATYIHGYPPEVNVERMRSASAQGDRRGVFKEIDCLIVVVRV